MGCIYYYKGYKFNSEIELDDFLIEREPLLENLGDIVFSKEHTTAQLTALNLLNQNSKDSQELQRKYKEFIKNAPYNEDGEKDLSNPPYIGVNRFLGQVVVDDRQLLLNFIPDEYWSRREEKWAEGEYTEDEIKLFGVTQGVPTIKQMTDEVDSKGNKLSNYQVMRNKMQGKWDTQGKIGTAIHNVLQLYFTYDSTDGLYGFEKSDTKEYIKKYLENKNRKYLFPSGDDTIIDQCIAYCEQLRQDLTTEFGENLIFMPEFTISSDVINPKDNKKETILGIVDLIIIDSNGVSHILDYKTSIKDYSKFGVAKKMAYNYQMAVYHRVLERLGLNVYSGSLMVAPIQINNFSYDDEDRYSYDGIAYIRTFETVTQQVTPHNWGKIDQFLPPILRIQVSSEKLMENTTKFMEECWPSYGSVGMITEKGVIRHLKKLGLLERPESGIYTYKAMGSTEAPITSDNEAEFIKKVLEYRKNLTPRKLRLTGDIKSVLRKAIKEESPDVNWPQQSMSATALSATWFRDTMQKYCNQRWEVIDNDVLDNYGIIQLYNKDTRQVDYIKISTNNLTTNYRDYLDNADPNKKRKSLMATFDPDIIEQSKTDSLMLEGAIGNIELMEAMAIINQLNGLEQAIIGNISVVNPYDAEKVSATNEELEYCFDRLVGRTSIFPNNFSPTDGVIKLASKYQLVSRQLADILTLGELKQWKDGYKKFENFKSCTSLMHQAIVNPEDQIAAIEDLLHRMQNDRQISQIIAKNYRDPGHLHSDLISLHNQLLMTLADLKGINFRQQLRDHGQWFEDVFNASASYIDNPGNLKSATLNMVTKLVTEAYQNTREEIQRKKVELSKYVEEVKNNANFGYIKENIGFNQVDLYKDLYVWTADGDLLFKNISEVQDPAKRALLEYALEEINKNRHPDWSKEIRDQKKNSYDIQYYRVPLARGNADSIVSSRGLMSLLKEKLHSLNPKVLLEKSREKLEGVYNAQTSKNTKIANLYQMTNLFDRGEESTENRLKIIQKYKDNGSSFELNLEYLLLKHQFAFAQQRNIDKVFPLIKAAAIHLSQQGANQNEAFEQDLKYIEEYITNKIHHKSIVNPNLQEATEVVNNIKKAASMLTLAFAPVQMFYQPLQGLWQDISLMIRKPDGKDSFTFNHFKNAIKIVYSDLFNFSGKPTLCSLLNETYALNDMDMNTYIERISKTRKGVWNFENMAFKFASRPDYYNRMSIFLSQMQGDGCLEAHSIENGRLVYDWKKDKRFSKFAANPKLKTSDPEYNRQKSLYYTIAKQLEAENTVCTDGKTPFRVNMNDPMPLPKAYSTKQSESMKSLSDDIYGYYSDEKKALIMSTAFGSMWLQFKTYWTGKRNQYLQTGGVRLRGSWEHYSEKDSEGKTIEYYYQVSDSGEILFNEPPITTETIAPVMQWKGQWQEGILVTLGDLAMKTIRDPKHFLNHFQDKWNNSNEDLKRCYQSNMKQFAYDVVMFAIIGSLLASALGDWLDELKDENKKNEDFMTGVKLAAANVAVMSVKNSFLDLNFIESIGSPIGQWTPFAIEWATRQYKNILKTASGDEDIWDGILNIASVNKQIKPLFDAIKPEQFRTKREGGTWESATAKRNREKRENK